MAAGGAIGGASTMMQPGTEVLLRQPVSLHGHIDRRDALAHARTATLQTHHQIPVTAIAAAAAAARHLQTLSDVAACDVHISTRRNAATSMIRGRISTATSPQAPVSQSSGPDHSDQPPVLGASLSELHRYRHSHLHGQQFAQTEISGNDKKG
jgi:hypothetical protein